MRSLRGPMTLSGVILLGAVSMHAQDLETVRANVPFPFKIGHAILPAGVYELRYDDGTMPGVLRVRRQDGRAGAFALTEKADIPKTSDDRPKLVFTNDGGRYVLAEVVDPGYGLGLQVVRSPRPNAEPERAEVPTD